jgi:hypothetical protein
MNTSPSVPRKVAPALLAGLAAWLLGVVPAAAEPVPLPAALQARVNQAIDQGSRYLRAQVREGSWNNSRFVNKHTYGFAALMGLTLLECGVPSTDPSVQRVATFARRNGSAVDTTYELSLGILFLDRLGDRQDEELIQSMAVHLLAGQSLTGGWTYKCPRVGPQTRQEILLLLRQLDPQAPGGIPALAGPGRPQLPAVGAPKPAPDAVAAAPARGQLDGTVAGPGRANPAGTVTGKPAPGAASGASGKPAPGGVVPFPPPNGKDKPDAPDAPAAPADVPAPPRIPARLRTLVVFQDPEMGIPGGSLRGEGGPLDSVTDNSNTQFATLALWAAQRHGVPMARTLTRISRRFETSQNEEGGWVYRYEPGGKPRGGPAMTCVGLIGLAVGHGAARRPGAPADKPVVDQRVVNGLVALAHLLEEPAASPGPFDLYFLWSVERVGVLYDLPAIGDQDWYRWGVEILLPNQTASGSWGNGTYVGHHPILDTCMALLFLKRANLTGDLTRRLPFRPGDLTVAVARRSGGNTRAGPTGPPPGLRDKAPR